MSILYTEFRHITEEALREWKNSSSGSGGGFKYLGPVPMHRFIYEFCWAVARGDLPIQKCKVALDSVEFCSGEKSKEGMDSVFADIIAHIAQDNNIPGDCRSRLVKLLRPKRSTQSSISKQQRQDVTKDDSKTAKSISRNVNQSPGVTLDRDGRAHPSEGRQGVMPVPSNGNLMIVDAHGNLPAAEVGASRSSDLRLSSAKDIDNVDAPDTARFISDRPPQPTNHDDLLQGFLISHKRDLFHQKSRIDSSNEEKETMIQKMVIL